MEHFSKYAAKLYDRRKYFVTVYVCCSLHIPSTCPGQWRSLMEACGRYEADGRPTFVEVLKTLDEIARSKFHQMTNDSDFYSLQDDWKREIDDMLNNIRAREHVRT